MENLRNPRIHLKQVMQIRVVPAVEIEMPIQSLCRWPPARPSQLDFACHETSRATQFGVRALRCGRPAGNCFTTRFRALSFCTCPATPIERNSFRVTALLEDPVRLHERVFGRSLFVLL